MDLLTVPTGDGADMSDEVQTGRAGLITVASSLATAKRTCCKALTIQLYLNAKADWPAARWRTRATHGVMPNANNPHKVASRQRHLAKVCFTKVCFSTFYCGLGNWRIPGAAAGDGKAWGKGLQH